MTRRKTQSRPRARRQVATKRVLACFHSHGLEHDGQLCYAWAWSDLEIYSYLHYKPLAGLGSSTARIDQVVFSQEVHSAQSLSVPKAASREIERPAAELEMLPLLLDAAMQTFGLF